jgi:hypothetical protein
MTEELPALAVAGAVLARAFPPTLPTLQDAAPDAAVVAAYWRARGQQDVINHLTGLCAVPDEV